MVIRNLLVSTLILLCAFGFVYELINHTVKTLLYLGGFAISAIIIYFLAKLIFKSSVVRTDEQKAYARAVKQSKKKHNKTKKAAPSNSLKVKKRDASHLKVIEGGKKKVN